MEHRNTARLTESTPGDSLVPIPDGAAADLDKEQSYGAAKVGFHEAAYQNAGKTVLLEAVAHGILTGAFLDKDLRSLTARARHLAADDDAYGAFKRTQLPGFTVSGIFEPTRRAENLAKHSGLVVLDLDHLEDAVAARAIAAESPHVAAAFLSHSGSGLKVLVPVYPIPTNAADQRAAWQAAVEHLGHVGPVDPSGKDLPRLTFLPHDPDAYLPLKARPLVWKGEVVPELPATHGKPADSIPTDAASGTAGEVDSTGLDDALDHLARKQVGTNDSQLLQVMFCLKAMGRGFQEFDDWAARADCTCADRRRRWDSAQPDDHTYGPIFALARDTGWKQRGKKGKNGNGADRQEKRPGGNKGDDGAVEKHISDTVRSARVIHWQDVWYVWRAAWEVQDATVLEREIVGVLARSRGVTNPVVTTSSLLSYMRSLSLAVTPPCVDTGLLAMENRMLAFHLDTGEVIRGTIFDNTSVEVRDDGKILTRDVDARWLAPTRRPYTYPLQDPGDPPLFDAWLAERFRDEPSRDAFYATLGATLLQELGHNQRLVALLGTRGSTGKGTIFSTLEILLGPGQVASMTSPTRLAGNFALGDIGHKSLLIFPDMPEMPTHAGQTKDLFSAGMAVLKNITGGDAVAVERKFKNPRTAHLNVGVWIASNFNLTATFGGTDYHSWDRRVVPFPMEQTLPRDMQIPEFHLRFVPERRQIAWKAIQFYADSKRNGTSFVRTEAMSKLARSMREGSAVDAYVESLQLGADRWISRESLEMGLRATGRSLSVTVGQSDIKNLFRQLRHTIGVSERKQAQERGFAGVGDQSARPT